MKRVTVEFQPQGITMDTDRHKFALAMKTWRLRAGLTQDQVAHKWGMSRYTIIRVERAKSISWTMAYRVFAHLAQELKAEEL